MHQSQVTSKIMEKVGEGSPLKFIFKFPVLILLSGTRIQIAAIKGSPSTDQAYTGKGSPFVLYISPETLYLGDDALSTKPVMHYRGTAYLCY